MTLNSLLSRALWSHGIIEMVFKKFGNFFLSFLPSVTFLTSPPHLALSGLPLKKNTLFGSLPNTVSKDEVWRPVGGGELNQNAELNFFTQTKFPEHPKSVFNQLLIIFTNSSRNSTY